MSVEKIRTLMPESFPLPWASSWGQDDCGLWNGFEYKGVEQIMRWIIPGTFTMGSPEDEVDRRDREAQHEVFFPKGFWLAETACTQQLWEAVMGDNPSHFKGDLRPVEMVSWKDVQKFIGILNDEMDRLSLRLPTEAEWEYACRAETITAFYFGKNITPEQVNYCGDVPYSDGEKGLNRKKTVEVKTLPENPWGLYEMHGNVWEWCSDWFLDEYVKDVRINPQGPPSGVDRVVRGGSWCSDGGDVRSACRGWSEPDDRDNGTGFRLALGH